MTATPEAAGAPSALPATSSPLVSLIFALAAPALILLTIVVHFLRFHEYGLLLPESLILMGGAAGIGALVGAVSRLRPATLGPALIAITLGVFVFYRPELTSRIMGIVERLGETIGDVGVALGLVGLGLFIAFCSITWLLRRHLNTIVVAVFGTIVLTTIALPISTGGEPVESGSLPADLKDLPPVIHIILDEHIGLAGLPPEMPESAPAARAIEATYKDFALFSRAYSRFAETQFSLASLMNHDLGEDVSTALDSRSDGYTLTGSAWFDRLKDQGYATRVYQSTWLDMCSRNASVDACYTHSLYSPNAFQRTRLSTMAKLEVLLGRLYIGGAHQLPSALASMEALERVRSDIAQTPRGVAYIVHLMMPHDGYLYKRDCTLADPSEWGEAVRDHGVTAEIRSQLYRLYLEQLTCSNLAMRRLLDELKRLGVYDEATIIVHGDHGSRIGERAHILDSPPSLTQQDLRDHYSTLLAIKAPGMTPGLRQEPEALQSVFATSFLGGRNGDRIASDEVFLRQGKKGPFHTFTLDWPNYSPLIVSGTSRSDKSLRAAFE
jgi:hypothetical protein